MTIDVSLLLALEYRAFIKHGVTAIIKQLDKTKAEKPVEKSNALWHSRRILIGVRFDSGRRNPLLNLEAVQEKVCERTSPDR